MTKEQKDNAIELLFEIYDAGVQNKTIDLTGYLDDVIKALSLHNVVGQSEQLSLSDFRVGFEYEELQMDSERYLNRGMIWVKKTYGLNSPRLHKIQKLIEEGKLRKA